LKALIRLFANSFLCFIEIHRLAGPILCMLTPV
jgi:hypothetical protein